MSITFYKEIINNYKKLYETEEGYDVKIYAGEKPNIKEFHVHSFILQTHSEFFKKTFITKDGIEKKDDHFILNLSHSPQIFEILLRYMYCGNFDLTTLQSCEILKLLLSSDELELQSLITYIQETLIKNHKDFIIKNVLEIVELTYQKKFLNKLWDSCIQEICYDSNHFFESTNFLILNPAILEIILKRDDFYLSNEIIGWENLLKWACGQQPVIQQDVNKWNKNEFKIMERRLNRFIPLIRFYHISSKDFLLKIYPFKELLPNDLVNNILAHHMAPNNKLNINIQPPRFLAHLTTIKSQEIFNIFASWIDKKQTMHYSKIGQIPYRFKLLYRNRGKTVTEFHNKCDNKGATIVIAKVTNSEQIIGGYNPLKWDSSNSWKKTNDSFIFSFTDRTNFQSAKVGYSKNEGYSIYCNSNYGPTFGGGHDLCCQNNGTWYIKNPHTYSEIHKTIYNINVDDYEVFQVIRNS
ncbi:BTB/POZ domain-containing protein [Glomus cerebriforme]|uniref:BTB/POZ domain-containing protein n=1 Tax=Glomus cerebriforme TaxID=658196 RepID=A0A397SQ79_9GLOM|nr:BTB/POZ domain-containing protein [Glomus cerebriforme]